MFSLGKGTQRGRVMIIILVVRGNPRCSQHMARSCVKALPKLTSASCKKEFKPYGIFHLSFIDTC